MFGPDTALLNESKGLSAWHRVHAATFPLLNHLPRAENELRESHAAPLLAIHSCLSGAERRSNSALTQAVARSTCQVRSTCRAARCASASACGEEGSRLSFGAATGMAAMAFTVRLRALAKDASCASAPSSTISSSSCWRRRSEATARCSSARPCACSSCSSERKRAGSEASQRALFGGFSRASSSLRASS